LRPWTVDQTIFFKTLGMSTDPTAPFKM